jgi:alpha-amylase
VSLAQGNDSIGIALETTLSEPAGLWWAPVETVSNSEAGFERVYQGAGILFHWPLSLAGGESRTVTVTNAVTTARDRALDEDGDPTGAPATT